MSAKHYKASCNNSRTNDVRAINARLGKAEDSLRELCRRRGVTVDGLTRDTRTADAKALDGTRKHLTGNAPRTADESNHLASLAARNVASTETIQKINEANSQRGLRGMLERALAVIR
jgi:hypothetical protein